MLWLVSLSTLVTDKRGQTSVESFYFNAYSMLKLTRHGKNGDILRSKFGNRLSKVRFD